MVLGLIGNKSTLSCTDTVPFPNTFKQWLVEASDEEPVAMEPRDVEG